MISDKISDNIPVQNQHLPSDRCFSPPDRSRVQDKNTAELSEFWSRAFLGGLERSNLSPNEKQLKKQALETFQKLGLPDKGLESWIYTNPIHQLFSVQAIFNLEEKHPIGPLALPFEGSESIFIIQDGRVVKNKLPASITLEKFQNITRPEFYTNGLSVIHDLNPQSENHQLTWSNSEPNPSFLVLNQTMLSERVIADVALTLNFKQNTDNTVFVYVNSKDLGPGLDWLRLEINVESNARAQIVFVKDQINRQFHYHQLVSRVKRDGHLHLFCFSPGGSGCRTEIETKLLETNASFKLSGLTTLANLTHLDTHVEVHHMVPHTESQQLYKAVVSGEAHGIYSGKVIIAPGAKGSNAEQVAKGLLLSKKSQFHTRPQLEVYNEDVKCGHGAAVGQLNPEEAFYLESRGITPVRAKEILLKAFIEEVILTIANPKLRNLVSTIVAHHTGNLAQFIQEKINHDKDNSVEDTL